MTLLGGAAAMPGPDAARGSETRRIGIIDVGSNSVRLVVYDGPARMPFILFNEKVMAGLGAALGTTGRIEDGALERGIAAIERFARLCTIMAVDDVRCVATAAVRDASNGTVLIERAASAGVAVRLLSGTEEGRVSAHGLISGMPGADGIMGDLGGGSLELARVKDGKVHQTISLPLGVLRVAQIRKEGKITLDRHIGALLGEAGGATFEQGLPFYMIGGSWRSLGRLDMALTRYPLPIIHNYEMPVARIPALKTWLEGVGKVSRVKAMRITASRVPTLPDAADVLAAITAQLKSSRLIVSAYGLREGLLYEALTDDVARLDPLLVAARVEGNAQGRFVGHGDQIGQWIAPLFKDDAPGWKRIRLAACLLADVGWRANPEFRAERGLEVALHGNWAGLDAEERAVLGQALHANFGGSTSVLPSLEKLARTERLARAVQWGLAIRLCQRLSGGAAAPLGDSALYVEDGTIVLKLEGEDTALAGEIVQRRLRQLGQAMGLPARLEA